MEAVYILLLILLANGAPLIVGYLLSNRWQTPIDGGRFHHDGYRLLGPSKTWRGLVSALLACTLAAPLIGFSPQVGFLVALTAMLGDLISSFGKRRLGLRSSAVAMGIDQIPEALLPAVLVGGVYLNLTAADIAVVVLGFVLVELLSNRPLYRLGIRKLPTG